MSEEKLDTQKALTMDMIQPTDDNLITPNGFFKKKDPKLGKLYDRFSINPENLKHRFKYLEYIARTGDDISVETYLFITNNKCQQLSGKLRLKELQLLASLYECRRGSKKKK